MQRPACCITRRPPGIWRRDDDPGCYYASISPAFSDDRLLRPYLHPRALGATPERATCLTQRGMMGGRVRPRDARTIRWSEPRVIPPRSVPVNDLTARDDMWRRFDGDDWAAFDALPRAVRQRLHEHAYDAWAVNALILWKTFRRKHACSKRALNTLLRYLDECEALELAAFDARHLERVGSVLPHVAAAVPVLRYGSRDRIAPPD